MHRAPTYQLDHALARGVLAKLGQVDQLLAESGHGTIFPVQPGMLLVSISGPEASSSH